MSQTLDASTPHDPSTRKTSLSLIFLIVFIDLLGFAIVLPLLPRYAEKLHASPPVIGLLMASFSAMQFIFSPLWGRVSDRVGRRPVLLAGLCGSVVFYGLFGVATMLENLPLIFVARIGAGIAGATISTAQAYIADATGVKGRARGMALIGAAFGAGFTFGPILGFVAIPSGPLKAGEIAALNPMPGFLASGLSLLALIFALIKLPESLRGNAPVVRRAWLNIGAIREAINIPSVGALLLLFFMSTFAFTQFETTLSLLTKKAFGYSDDMNFKLFTYLGVTLSIMQGFVVRNLVNRIGEARMIVLGIVLMGASLWVVGIAADEKSSTLLFEVMPFLVAGFSFMTPSAQALISRRSDPARQGEIMGVNQSASAMARILGPIFGYSLLPHGLSWPYKAGALMLLPAFLMAVSSVASGQDWPAPAPVEP